MHRADETSAPDAPPSRRALRRDLLASIVRLEAPLGVLSVYAGADPAEPDRARIELKNQCALIEAAREDSESAEQLHDAMQHLQAGVQETLRGPFSIAGFIPVGGPARDAIWVDLPPSVATLVTRDASPDTLPLVAMIERFGECGVVTVARDRIAVYQSARGTVDELARHAVGVDTASWRDTDGPSNAVASGRSGASGVGAMSTIGSSDAYEQKLDNATVAELVGVAAPLIDRLAAERCWERVMWFGDAAVVKAICASLRRDDLVHIGGDGAHVLDESRDELAARVDRARDASWTRDGEALVESLRERRPGHRVESVEEAGTLAREGRIEELAVMVPDTPPADARRHDINELLGDVLRHGGHVHALHAPDDDAVNIVAGLRW